MEVNKNETVALVGQSGCGKSTTFQLIQRFYDSDAGELAVDNCSIQAKKIKDLRHKLGVVQQEPILFERTIADNIRYGLIDLINFRGDIDKHDEAKILADSIPFEEVEKAAKQANADKFINELPDKYDTTIFLKKFTTYY